MRRRDFITLVGGVAAATLPNTVSAQQPEQVRRVGVLMNRATDEPEDLAYLAAFRQALQKLGWPEGRLQIDYRWASGDADLVRKYAAELVALAPDVILAAGSPSVAALQRVTRSLPIVFVRVSDPVGGGLVDSLARPGGNVTGFMQFEYSFGGKWLELLKQIAPQVTRAAVLRNSENRAGTGEFAAIQSAAQPLNVELRPIDTRDASEIERSVEAFARFLNGGLIVAPSATTGGNRNLIITLAARHKLPAGLRRSLRGRGRRLDLLRG